VFPRLFRTYTVLASLSLCYLIRADIYFAADDASALAVFDAAFKVNGILGVGSNRAQVFNVQHRESGKEYALKVFDNKKKLP
jgi:hypothetical protein